MSSTRAEFIPHVCSIFSSILPPLLDHIKTPKCLLKLMSPPPCVLSGMTGHSQSLQGQEALYSGGIDHGCRFRSGTMEKNPAPGSGPLTNLAMMRDAAWEDCSVCVEMQIIAAFHLSLGAGWISGPGGGLCFPILTGG